jgi:hypothetical protein
MQLQQQQRMQQQQQAPPPPVTTTSMVGNKSKVVLSDNAKQALAKAIWSSIRSPTGDIEHKYMQAALQTGLPRHAILNAVKVVRERDAAKRQLQQQQQYSSRQQQQQPRQPHLHNPTPTANLNMHTNNNSTNNITTRNYSEQIYNNPNSVLVNHMNTNHKT